MAQFDLADHLHKIRFDLNRFRGKNGVKLKISFKDVDGSMVMNRTSDASYWDDPMFVKYSLETDARERGVRILNITIDFKQFTINCTVDYLRKGR